MSIVGLLVTEGSHIFESTMAAGPDETSVRSVTPDRTLPGTSPRRPATSPAGPAPVTGGANTPDDRFAAAVVAGVEQFWRTEFPARFGRPWRDIRGFLAADPADAANPPPCLRRSLDLSEQALYCPVTDSIAWDRAILVPELRRQYGDAAVVVALAHEMGHAVQDRIGVDVAAQLAEPERFPTILLEGMADCFAGVALDAVARGEVAGLSAEPVQVDRALQALLTFRDPAGTTARHASHGTAFDRASAFVRGYRSGARSCAAMTVLDVMLTERASATGPARGTRDQRTRADADTRDWFARLTASRGHRLPSVALVSGVRCPPASCVPATVSVSRGRLESMRRRFGDYAGATVVASRYALVSLSALGRPAVGPLAGRTAVCLAGAYTRTVLARGSGVTLSPGDLDEAVDSLLADDQAARDAAGHPPAGDMGLDRVHHFRTGVLGGPAGCGI
ncbi:MAG: neutral zinc metallopeptidase [Pseudonocardia sp.]